MVKIAWLQIMFTGIIWLDYIMRPLVEELVQEVAVQAEFAEVDIPHEQPTETSPIDTQEVSIWQWHLTHGAWNTHDHIVYTLIDGWLL